MGADKAKRSTKNGVEQTARLPGSEREVPSWVAATGVSVKDAAAALGGRVLAFSETMDAAKMATVTFEVHERDGRSFWCVAK